MIYLRPVPPKSRCRPCSRRMGGRYRERTLKIMLYETRVGYELVCANYKEHVSLKCLSSLSVMDL